MKSNYDIVLIKIRLDLGNDGYIILYNFGDRIMSGFKVIEGGPSESLPVQVRKNKAGLNYRVN